MCTKCDKCNSEDQVQILFLNKERAERVGLSIGSHKLCLQHRLAALRRTQQSDTGSRHPFSEKKKTVIPVDGELPKMTGGTTHAKFLA